MCICQLPALLRVIMDHGVPRKQFGVKIRAFVGPNGELLFLASDEDSWKLSPWESKIDIDNGDEITAIVDNPQQEQEPESGD